MSDSAFEACSELRSIVIPQSVVFLPQKAFFRSARLADVAFEVNSQLSALETRAFAGCQSLHSIIIPLSVCSLGARCFANCGQLSTVKFEPGSRLSTIEPTAFEGCLSLMALHLPALVNLRNGASLAAPALQSITVDEAHPTLVARGPWLFDSSDFSLIKYCGIDSEVVIPAFIQNLTFFSFHGSPVERVTFEPGSRASVLGACAFANCGTLVSISLPASIKSIESNCFQGCWVLRSVEFESGSKISAFGASAFALCGLDSICIPASTTEICKSCFPGPLSAVTFEPNGKLWRIHDSAFSGTILTSICIPKSVSEIGSRCFGFCHWLLEVTFERPSHVEMIQDGAFAGCSALESICIPASVCKLCKGALADCKVLANVIFESPSQLYLIGDEAFRNCDSLNSISIPASVTTIGRRCFEMCGQLSQVQFARRSRLAQIWPCTFWQCPALKEIWLPRSVLSRFGFELADYQWYKLIVLRPDFALSRIENVPASRQIEHCPGPGDDAFWIGYQTLLQHLMFRDQEREEEVEAGPRSIINLFCPWVES
jgi:hypothetical protein